MSWWTKGEVRELRVNQKDRQTEMIVSVQTELQCPRLNKTSYVK